MVRLGNSVNGEQLGQGQCHSQSWGETWESWSVGPLQFREGENEALGA